MTCNACGAALPPGVAFCPNCGAATPYNTTGQNAPAYGSASYDPTFYSQPNQQTLPATGYGAYGTPSDPYGSTSSPSANPYGTPPYGTPSPYNGQTNYGASPAPAVPPAPPMHQLPPLPLPPQQNYGYAVDGPVAYNGLPAHAVAPKRKSRVGLIVGIVLLVLVVACGGLIAALAALGKAANNTVQTTQTQVAATTTIGNVPSTSSIASSAAAILFGATTASAIDSSYNPTQQTNTFTVGQTVYVTFNVDSHGNDGYIKAAWYLNGQEIKSDGFTHKAKNDHGYFSLPYNEAGSGALAMYWCTQASCTDQQLALVKTFTVA